MSDSDLILVEFDFNFNFDYNIEPNAPYMLSHLYRKFLFIFLMVRSKVCKTSIETIPIYYQFNTVSIE